MSQPIKKLQSIHTMKRAQCDQHGLQPYYAACTCVVKFGLPPAHVLRPSQSRTGAGEILCQRKDHEMHELVLVCAHCAVSNGWDKIR